jgi:phytanoyl-CoA hydroxylase
MGLGYSLREKGFERVPSVFSAIEIREASDVVDRLISTWPGSSDPDFWAFHEHNEDTEVLYRIHNLEKKNEIFLRLIRLSRFRSIVRRVMGAAVPTACALVYKMPRIGAEIPWHRDPIDVPPNTVFNFSIFLDPASPENGPLSFVPGSHLHDQGYPAGRPRDAVAVQAAAGDVLIHDVRVYHGSGRSRSATPRRSIIIEFQPVRLARTSIN